MCGGRGTWAVCPQPKRSNGKDLDIGQLGRHAMLGGHLLHPDQHELHQEGDHAVLEQVIVLAVECALLFQPLHSTPLASDTACTTGLPFELAVMFPVAGQGAGLLQSMADPDTHTASKSAVTGPK